MPRLSTQSTGTSARLSARSGPVSRETIRLRMPRFKLLIPAGSPASSGRPFDPVFPGVGEPEAAIALLRPATKIPSMNSTRSLVLIEHRLV